jgi:hypothetical protein
MRPVTFRVVCPVCHKYLKKDPKECLFWHLRTEHDYGLKQMLELILNTLFIRRL